MSRGKSELRRTMVPGNSRGIHNNNEFTDSATENILPFGAKVKRQGKSLPLQ